MRPAAGPVRRVVLILVVVAGSAATTAAVSGGGAESGYQVDAIFDTASFLTPGQKVTIAGAEAGRVEELSLTPDRRARVTLVVDERFAPFRSDGECTIQPQSLIGERFVDCVPGTPRGDPLRRSSIGVPTLPVERTHAPVDLDLVLGSFAGSTNERLALLLNELGAGMAGRSDDLDAVVRRANPALQQTRRVLAILRRDRARLGPLIDDAEAVLRPLARRRAEVASFVDHADAVSAVTARRRVALAEAVRELPPLLRTARPSLNDFADLARGATPLAADLRRAAPGAHRLLRDLSRFAGAAPPALRRLARMSDAGTRAVRPAAPEVARLRRFAAAARPVGAQLAGALENVKQRGVIEGAQTFLFFATLVTSRFDADAHLPVALAMPPATCAIWATVPVPGCSARFGTDEHRAARRRTATGDDSDRRRRSPARDRRRPADERETRTPPPSVRVDPSPPSEPKPPAAPQPPAPVPGLDPTPPPSLPPHPAGEPPVPPTDGGQDPASGLLDFLLG